MILDCGADKKELLGPDHIWMHGMWAIPVIMYVAMDVH